MQFPRVLRAAFGAVVIELLFTNAWAQDPAALLNQQRTALEAAKSEQVHVLAPRTYARALQQLEAAQRDMEKGRKPERVREDIATLAQTLSEARRLAEQARKELATLLKTRDDAIAAQAPKFVPQEWQKADERFGEAIARAEREDFEGARKRGAEADVLLRDAELLAIKADTLGEARALIAQADEGNVAEHAPRSLAQAKRYLSQADQEISQSRYDRDVPKRLAAQAAYEARHAMYLAQRIAGMGVKDKDGALESVFLEWEDAVRKVAGEVDLVPDFQQGYAGPMQQLQERVQRQHEDLLSTRQELGDRQSEVVLLNEEMRRLEDRLGGVSQERVVLQRRVDAQERLRTNIAKIETSFSPSEARVYRQGDDAVISLTGINFRVGKSTIEPSSFVLLGKVQDAIKLFPNAAIVVEGHTDADGSDSANLILSQDRADAVKQYLVSNMGVNPEKISSIGYGETRPVANNETAEGRARNRRIDLVLRIDPNQL